MIEKLGGRKAVFSLLAVAVSVAVVIVKGDVPAGLKDMLQFILGAFVAGNVGSKVVNAVESRKVEAPAQEAPVQAEPVVSAPAPQQDQVIAGLLEIYNEIKQNAAISEQRHKEVLEALSIQQSALSKTVDIISRRV